eukprot:5343386-Karenia_brevis.AAC.1
MKRKLPYVINSFYFDDNEMLRDSIADHAQIMEMAKDVEAAIELYEQFSTITGQESNLSNH